MTGQMFPIYLKEPEARVVRRKRNRSQFVAECIRHYEKARKEGLL